MSVQERNQTMGQLPSEQHPRRQYITLRAKGSSPSTFQVKRNISTAHNKKRSLVSGEESKNRYLRPYSSKFPISQAQSRFTKPHKRASLTQHQTNISSSFDKNHLSLIQRCEKIYKRTKKRHQRVFSMRQNSSCLHVNEDDQNDFATQYLRNTKQDSSRKKTISRFNESLKERHVSYHLNRQNISNTQENQPQTINFKANQRVKVNYQQQPPKNIKKKELLEHLKDKECYIFIKATNEVMCTQFKTKKLPETKTRKSDVKIDLSDAFFNSYLKNYSNRKILLQNKFRNKVIK